MASVHEGLEEVGEVGQEASCLFVVQYRDVNQVLQAFGASLVQPCVLLLPSLVAREGRRVAHFRSDMVEDRDEDTLKNALPERVCESSSMTFECIEEHLERG